MKLFRVIISILSIILLPITASSQVVDFCPALAPASGNIVNVSSSSALASAVSNAQAGDSIIVSPGTYTVGILHITDNDLTIRSSTGNPDDVVLDGGYSGGSIVFINGADDVTIADLTIMRSHFHLVHITGASERSKLYNLKFIDAREQFVKINDNSGIPQDGEIACSSFELTSAGRTHIHNNPTPGFQCYTGGIDSHASINWHVRDNHFQNIYCTNGGLAEHAIHFWDAAADTLVERNVVVNCARGIGFGLGSSGHTGGQIINNFVCSEVPGSPGIDVGIGLESAANVFVAHNSIYMGSSGFNHAIDQRFAATTGTIINNLYNTSLSNRNGANGNFQNNLLVQTSIWQDIGSCDLHLVDTAPGFNLVVDQALATSVDSDFDGQNRGTSADLGADEFGVTTPDSSKPSAPVNLRISN